MSTMKKRICLLLSALLLCSLAACGGSGKNNGEAFVWKRQGYFTDGNENILSVQPSGQEKYPGWYVSLFLDWESRGWYLQQEGDSLHGDLIPDGEEGEFIVTIAEEGEDGLLLTTPDGKELHFTPMQSTEETFTVEVKTEGQGWIAFVGDDDDLPPVSEYDRTSVRLSFDQAATYLFDVRADEGWRFVKWTKDGEDYSTECQITVELTGDAAFVAVFEPTE